ncbi:hypothetical protein NHF46_20345 [Arthrobacter alpinus]|nr:hypothetical protein [Arthrobacter alpinus]
MDNLSNFTVEVRPTAGNFDPLRRTNEGGTSNSGNCGFGTFIVGQSYTCATPLHLVTAAELADGFFVPQTTWRTTGGGLTETLPVTGEEVDLLVRKPSLSATHVGAELVDVDASGYATVGDSISYTSVITNTGNVRLTGVTVAGQGAFELAPAESKTLTSLYTLTAADVAANKVVNGLVVTAKNGALGAASSVSAAPLRLAPMSCVVRSRPWTTRSRKSRSALNPSLLRQRPGSRFPTARCQSYLMATPTRTGTPNGPALPMSSRTQWSLTWAAATRSRTLNTRNGRAPPQLTASSRITRSMFPTVPLSLAKKSTAAHLQPRRIASASPLPVIRLAGTSNLWA